MGLCQRSEVNHGPTRSLRRGEGTACQGGIPSLTFPLMSSSRFYFFIKYTQGAFRTVVIQPHSLHTSGFLRFDALNPLRIDRSTCINRSFLSPGTAFPGVFDYFHSHLNCFCLFFKNIYSPRPRGMCLLNDRLAFPSNPGHW